MSIQRTETHYQHYCPSAFPKTKGYAITGVAHSRSLTWRTGTPEEHNVLLGFAYCPFCGDGLPDSEAKADEEARK